jgi:hypothetical protein
LSAYASLLKQDLLAAENDNIAKGAHLGLCKHEQKIGQTIWKENASF